MAGTDIAIDLGSANFRLYVDGKGVVVDEPNVIAVDEDSNRVVAVGRRAYKMLGRTSDRVRVVKPVTGGVISDLTLMDATLQHYLKKVTNSRVSCRAPLWRYRAVLRRWSAVRWWTLWRRTAFARCA